MSTTPSLPLLPLSDLRADFVQALGRGPLLLEAEPGAGKSTLAPLWALAQADQAVWLIQPRVLATRALAKRLAQLLGEVPGQTVGYQVPYERQVGKGTRLLVMTPGILLQNLLHNPALEKVSTVLLDEVHERSVNQDTAWAWLQETRILREDLQLVLMSATPDPALRRQLKQRLVAPGRCFPVTLDYRAPSLHRGRSPALEDQVLGALESVPDWHTQTCLIFLPGWRAIEDTARALARHCPNQPVYRLHSRVPDAEQGEALDPGRGPRLILATNIAETSLTIADVTLVIDSGLVRQPGFEQRTGISRLHNRMISQASAEQRRGRAGRVRPGHCIRLWSQDQSLAAADLPEIRATDYLPLALRLAHWGSPVESLCWLDAPNPMALSGAREQLQYWRLLDDKGRVSDRGRQVADLGTHPRLAALLQAQGEKLPSSILHLALAVHFDWNLGEKGDDWLDLSVQELERNSQWRHQRKRWLQVLGAREEKAQGMDVRALAWAFRDRIGYRQDSGRYRLNTGISVEPFNSLESEWAVFPQIQARGKHHLSPGFSLNLDQAAQRQLSQPVKELTYGAGTWQRRIQWFMGGVKIAEDREILSSEEVAGELVTHIGARGLASFSWDPGARLLLRRARLAAEYQLGKVPDVSMVTLEANLNGWLEPFLNSQSRLEQLPWQAGLEYYLGHECCGQLEQWLPRYRILPSGRQVAIDYPDQGLPQISAKLQEFFGCERLVLADGRVPLQLHLASPNGSPLAITTDLASFWRQAYPEVRKQMRGRYPKHPWPEDPLTHSATWLTKKRLAQDRD